MTPETTTNAMSVISDIIGAVFDNVGTVITTITGQPILLFFFAVGAVPIVISTVKKLKG